MCHQLGRILDFKVKNELSLTASTPGNRKASSLMIISEKAGSPRNDVRHAVAAPPTRRRTCLRA